MFMLPEIMACGSMNGFTSRKEGLVKPESFPSNDLELTPGGD